jgi:hypothetical protein
MRKSTLAMLAGAGLVVGGVALAAEHNSHVMKVAMPDGSVAEIHYVGDVAPKVSIAPVSAASPILFLPADAAAPSLFDRIAADIDRQMDAMMQEVATMRAAPVRQNGQIDMAALKNMPAGSVHYSFVSWTNGKGSCSQSVQVTSYGQGQQPKIVQQNSGDCTKTGIAPIPAVTTTPAADAKVTPADYAKPAAQPKPKDTI